MTARHWVQIVALGSAFGLTGAAIAQNTEGTSTTGDRASASAFGMDTPSAGAIVTPADKALGMGRDNEETSVNPRSSNGRGLTGPNVNPAETDAGSPHPMRKTDSEK